MNIIITSGKGEGSTQLSAFDSALFEAGIANFNLLKLSSVIPPKSRLVIKQYDNNGTKGYGDRLYVVIAEKRETEKGREAWSGIGWVQAKDGRGLFVEHHGSQQAEVIRLINGSLTDMVKYRKQKYGNIHYQVVGTRCEDKPVCALVAAIYKTQPWNK